MWRFLIVFLIRIASILGYTLFPTHTRMNLWIYLFNWCIMSVSSVHAQSMHVSVCSSLEQKRPLFWPLMELAWQTLWDWSPNGAPSYSPQWWETGVIFRSMPSSSIWKCQLVASQNSQNSEVDHFQVDRFSSHLDQQVGTPFPGPGRSIIPHYLPLNPCWIHQKIPWFTGFKAQIIPLCVYENMGFPSSHIIWKYFPCFPPVIGEIVTRCHQLLRPLSSSHISSRWLWRCCCCSSHVRPSWGFSGDSGMAARCKFLKIEKKNDGSTKMDGVVECWWLRFSLFCREPHFAKWQRDGSSGPLNSRR